MQTLILRVNKPYERGKLDDTKLRYRLTDPYLYSFLAAIFASELLCVVLNLSDWNFCASVGLNFCISWIDLHTLNPWDIVLQVALLVFTFVGCLVIAVFVEAKLNKRLKSRLQRQNSLTTQQQKMKLGLSHPDIQAVRKPLLVFYSIFLLICLLVVFINFIYPARHLPFLSISVLIAFAFIFSCAPCWHFIRPRWPWPKHHAGTSIANLHRLKRDAQ